MRRFRSAPLLRPATVIGLAIGALGVALAGVRWGAPAGIQEVWFTADSPAGASRVGLLGNETLFLAAELLLLGSWVGLGLLVHLGIAGTRTVALGAVAGGAPLLVGAPVFSNDAYTYVAIGNLLEHGRDPYRFGWGAARTAGYAGHVDLVWRRTPSPYSPLLLRLLQLDARVAHGDLLAGVVLLRLAAVGAFAVLGIAVARAPGRPASAAAIGLWLSVANPLLSEHLLSGLHVDLYVALLLVLAVAAYAGGHPVGALVLVVLAAQLKVTAAVVLVVLAADVVLRARDSPDSPHPGELGDLGRLRDPGDPGGPRAKRGLLGGGLLLAGGGIGFAGVSALMGLGNGWRHALAVPALGRNSFTPVDAVADLARRAGLAGRRPTGFHIVSAPGDLRAGGWAVAVAVTCWAALRVRSLGVPLASAAALGAIAGFGSATWPWYLAPVIALTAVGPARPKLLVAVAGGSVALSLALKPGGGPMLLHAPVLADVATLGLVAGVLTVLLLPRVGLWGPARRFRAAR